MELWVDRLGTWTNESVLYALLALFALVASRRAITLPIGDNGPSKTELQDDSWCRDGA